MNKWRHDKSESRHSLLPKRSAEYSSYPLTQWHQSSLNEMKRPVTAAVPVWNPQTLWSSSWNGARRAHGRLLSLCLASPLPCGWCLASSSACVTFYGHIYCLGSGLWTSSKPMGSELISYIIGREKMYLAHKFKSTILHFLKWTDTSNSSTGALYFIE